MTNKNILILIPGKNARGGITNYYKSIRSNIPQSIFYLERGARNWPSRGGWYSEFIRMLSDYLLFTKFLFRNKIKCVQTTTSFSKNALWRDTVYIVLCKLFRLKIIVFFRGWDDALIPKMNIFPNSVLKRIYLSVDAIIDLRQKNIDQLILWGYKRKVFLETTVVDTQLIPFVPKLEDINTEVGEKFNILFLARIEKTKGIYEAIETYQLVQAKLENVSLTIAGDGTELEIVKDYCLRNKIEDVVFKGFVQGKEKADCYRQANVYLFPSYFEGMPSSVLESMAFGLPVITTNVGGLSTFFKTDVNGFITDENNPEVLAEYVVKLFNSKELRERIGAKNALMAQQRFSPEKVSGRILDIYNQLLD